METGQEIILETEFSRKRVLKKRCRRHNGMKKIQLLFLIFLTGLHQIPAAHACICGGVETYAPLSQLREEIRTAKEFLGKEYAKAYESSLVSKPGSGMVVADLLDLKITATFNQVKTEFKIPHTKLQNVISVIWKSDVWVETTPGKPFEKKWFFRRL